MLTCDCKRIVTGNMFKWQLFTWIKPILLNSHLVWFPCFCNGKVKTLDFSKTIVVYDIKVGRCSKLNEYVNLYDYQRSRSFIDLGPCSLRFNIFKPLFFRNRWAAMRIYGKHLKISKRSFTLKLGMQYPINEYYQMYSNEYPGMTLSFFTAKSYLVLYAFVWEKDKVINNILVYDIKVGRCSQSDEYTKLYEYQRSRSFIDLHPRSLRLNIFKLLFLRNS